MATADSRRGSGLYHHYPSQPLTPLRTAAHSLVCRLLICLGLAMLAASPAARLTRHLAAPSGGGSRHGSELHLLPRACPIPEFRPIRSRASGRRRTSPTLSRECLPDPILSPLFR